MVLGLCSFTHDSAAALAAGGRLVGMAEEERLSGIKHTREYPRRAVEWLLSEAGLSPADVGVVAYNFAGHRYLAGVAGSAAYLPRPATRRRAAPRAASYAVVHARYRQRMRSLREMFPNATVRGVSHHLAHGLYAFTASGLEEAAVLVVDSLGETHTTSVAHARAQDEGVRYRQAEALNGPASPGARDGPVTEDLGWARRAGERSPRRFLHAPSPPILSTPRQRSRASCPNLPASLQAGAGLSHCRRPPELPIPEDSRYRTGARHGFSTPQDENIRQSGICCPFLPRFQPKDALPSVRQAGRKWQGPNPCLRTGEWRSCRPG